MDPTRAATNNNNATNGAANDAASDGSFEDFRSASGYPSPAVFEALHQLADRAYHISETVRDSEASLKLPRTGHLKSHSSLQYIAQHIDEMDRQDHSANMVKAVLDLLREHYDGLGGRIVKVREGIEAQAKKIHNLQTQVNKNKQDQLQRDQELRLTAAVSAAISRNLTGQVPELFPQATQQYHEGFHHTFTAPLPRPSQSRMEALARQNPHGESWHFDPNSTPLSIPSTRATTQHPPNRVQKKSPAKKKNRRAKRKYNQRKRFPDTPPADKASTLQYNDPGQGKGPTWPNTILRTRARYFDPTTAPAPAPAPRECSEEGERGSLVSPDDEI
ncbi:hypothetical protein B0T26DRAFT_678683 [Lasiosphaeria miniovina]|uniref:Uncharacterized protein n=1 Tax=Lasiosphaeria miniovina TaxID=1954250 RepID=A0AA40A4Q6_9PEZI|nr:uncharacterized protein B0T26DRAFT_678683 [Lasiosphaeria miniovina]KAK0709232.1 hypothetical protein B0T26DRAFT_678683 [Lasiosphaeria miniovina]